MEAKQPLTIIKIGGAIIDSTSVLTAFYEQVKNISGPKIIIHGGGNYASQLQEKLGITPQKIDGRRITDTETLEVVTMVYAGLFNKKLVAGLQAIGKNAIGLSGVDGDAIRAHKREVIDIDYGFAGDIDMVNVSLIHELLTSGKTPVFCAITHNGKGQLLNTNADTLAAIIASAMSSLYHVQLFYCFDQIGVLENIDIPLSVIPKINQEMYIQLKKEGKIYSGMLPKLQTAFEALEKGVLQVHLGTIEILTDVTQKHTILCL